MLVPVETIVSLLALLFSDLSPLFLPHSSARFSAFYQLLPPLDSFSDSSSCCSPPESTYPREQLTRNIFVPLPSSLLFVLDSGEENYCFSRILLFYHFWNSSGVYGPLQWLPESFLSRYLRVSSFYGRRGIFRSIVFRNAYARLNVGYVRKEG